MKFLIASVVGVLMASSSVYADDVEHKDSATANESTNPVTKTKKNQKDDQRVEAQGQRSPWNSGKQNQANHERNERRFI